MVQKHLEKDRKSLKPVFVKFENPGDKVEGKWIGTSWVEGENGAYPLYILEDVVGRVKFAGTVQIVEALEDLRIGTYFGVELVEVTNLTKGRKMKEFNVYTFDGESVKVDTNTGEITEE